MLTLAYLAFLEIELPKNVSKLHNSWVFFEKMTESRPPLKLKYNGGLLSGIFSKNHSKCPQMTLENHQKSGF